MVAVAAEVGDVDELREKVPSRERRLRHEPDPPAEQLAAEPELRTRWSDDALHLDESVPGVDGVMIERALQREVMRSGRDRPSRQQNRPSSTDAAAREPGP